ncbi:aldose epimerase family protein [Streptomyces sp. NPDC059398]|uniref:aldose epimerase family protein n=1 Tax=Streptomyces sp. NPDC059398 TaxID=3346820 RepID=UPI0036CCD693
MSSAQPEIFGRLGDGTPVHRWTLERGGTRVRVLTYGGILQSVEVPDRTGAATGVALGFPDLAGYLAHPGPYFGALIGRYANRIAGGAFALDGRTYRLPRNNGPHSLHGGDRGFDKRVWEAEATGHGVRLSRVSPDGEEGYPGRLAVSVTYGLTESGALRIGYEATTDAPTVVSLTNHSYWNLGGAESGSAAGHELRIAASLVTPVDAELIPTGGSEPVAGTRFDFREARKSGPGYDHNYVLDNEVPGGGSTEAAELFDPASGRVLTITTSEPGLQLYTGDHIDDGPYGACAGIALETQRFPDAPNRPEFPSAVLRPDGAYVSETVYGFSTR